MVDFITYKKKKYPIRISYYVLMMAQKEAGVTLEELDSDFEAQQSMLWYALQAGAKMAGTKVDIPREEMVWVLDESYLEFQKAMYGFAKSLIEVQDEALRNEVPKKKSKR